MTSYHALAQRVVDLYREGEKSPLGEFPPLPPVDIPEDAPELLIFSPHPDDECLVGLLALRLLREAKVRVTNVAVTLGSNRVRRAGRLAELKGACRFLGFGLLEVAQDGLDNVNPSARASDPKGWKEKVDVIAGILRNHAPKLIVFPHVRDWNATHIGVNLLVTDALRELGGFQCQTIETEFWGAMYRPNLMVEGAVDHVGALMAATTFHKGEVERNPYHLTLPAWMLDNVRRGGEVVGGQGGEPPDYQFATLYRLGRWAGEEIEVTEPPRRMLSADVSAACLFG